MQVVSSTEFATHQQKYFDLARHQQVFVRDRDCTFVVEKTDEKKLLQPDDDFHRAISMDEFQRRALLVVEKLDKKYGKR